MRLTSALKYAALVFVFVLVLAGVAPAQVTTGTISGVVVDQSGAAIPGVQVIATSRATAEQTKVTTNEQGLFKLSSMPVGEYDLQFSKGGFSTTKVAAVSVVSGTDRGLGQVKLEVGAGSTTVEVSAAPPLAETTQAQVSSSFTSQQLSTFPGISEAEGLDNIALTVPGVSSSRDNSFSNSNGPDFAVNGIRSRNNDQQIDGQNNNDNSVGGPGLFLVNPDFVQEYDITVNNFSPEYGRNSGSAVNEVTKSGTNIWHGDLMGQENNSVFNALSNTQKASPSIGGQGLTKQPRSNNEFTGGTIGGAIWKNHVFAFGGFDDQIISSTAVNTAGLTPTPTGLGEMASCYSSNSNVTNLQTFGPFGIGGGNPTPTATNLVELAGAPNPNFNDTTINPTTNAAIGPVCRVELGTVTRTQAQPFHEFDWIYRTDAVISDQDRFFGRYVFNKAHSFGASAGGYPIDVPALSQTFLLDETHTFSSRMINEWRGSFSRLNVDFGGNSLGNTVPPMGQLLTALAHVAIGGGELSYGPATNLPQGRIVNTYQLQDNWSFFQGRNQWKAGVNFTYQRSPNVFLPNVNGSYSFNTFTNGGATAFNSQGGCTVAAGAKLVVPGVNGDPNNNDAGASGPLSAYACNIPTSVSVALGNSSLDFREYDTFLYMGDDYKLKSNFTLNLGVTWSYYGQPENLFHANSLKQQTSPQPFWNPALPLSITTAPTIPAVMNAFGPGIGFAYTPRWGGWLTGGDQGKTVLRGGYRLSYDPPFYNIYLNESTASPNVILQTLSGTQANANPLPTDPHGPSVRTALASQLVFGVNDPRSFNTTSVSPNFGPDRVHDWSFGIQREFGQHAVLEARYVGNHGYDLFQTINGNPLASGFVASGFSSFLPAGVTPCASTTIPGVPATAKSPALGRANCNEGVVRERTNTGYSDYNGLQTELRTNNLFNQLTLRTNYVWSKTTDNVSEIFSTFGAGNTVALSQNPFANGAPEHGLSGLNFPQTFTFTAWEDLPFLRSQHGLLGHIFGGYAVAATYILQSGQGYTPTQFCLAACTGLPSVNDTRFDAGFIGTDESSRPFVGSMSAPATSVGIFAGDACNLLGVGCSPTAANTLLDFGAANTTGAANPVTNKQVRYIVNAQEAETVFGTPFGNAERNLPRDYQTNSANISLYKNIKFSERTTLQFHATLNNAFNHPNFGSVDPFIDDAGFDIIGTGFGNPLLQGASSRVVYFGLKVIF